MKNIIIECKKLSEKAILPTKAHDGDACFDLCITRTSSLKQVDTGEFILTAHTDIALAIPKGYAGEIHLRSSSAFKPYTLANGVGIIDSGYRGEILIQLRFPGNIKNLGEYFTSTPIKIAQLKIVKLPEVELLEVSEFSQKETARGQNGFGSTGA